MVAIRDNREFEEKNATDTLDTPASSIGAQALLNSILTTLRRRISLFVWQGFLEPLIAVSYENDILHLQAPTLFHKDWVKDHYMKELIDVASEIAGKSIKIKLSHDPEELLLKKVAAEREAQAAAAKAQQVPVSHVAKQVSEDTQRSKEQLKQPQLPLLENSQLPRWPYAEKKPSSPAAPAVVSRPVRAETVENREHKDTKEVLETWNLNPNHTFDTYVPGPSNQIAFSACLAVAEQPGAQYSPLFLFGSVGLGKTHLLHSIGNCAKARHPGITVMYMSAEQWVNAYIQAIRERRFEAFRNRFRTNCDLLLIDDIQFLAGKDASQDEFFHTFNSLHQRHKQIVVTSDKYPHEIEGLEERLRTRLAWGLIADIRPPEIETRIAILHRKAESLRMYLPDDVAHYLASNISTSVRELEGALVRLTAFSNASKCEISLSHAREFLSPVFRRGLGGLTPERITEHVAHYYDLKPTDLKGACRQRQVALARQVAMALCRTHLSMSLPEIGRAFGGRDHTTVLSSLRKIDEMREIDIGLQTVISRIEKGLFEDGICELGM